MIKKILPLLFVGVLMATGSCKKCYDCTKTILVNVNGVDSTQYLTVEACNHGKEGNGQDNKTAMESYKANGYICVAQ